MYYCRLSADTHTHTIGSTHLGPLADTLTKREELPPAAGINPWQSTIYQHQLKQHYKLPEPLEKKAR